MPFKVIFHFHVRFSKFSVFILINIFRNSKVLFLETGLRDSESPTLTLFEANIKLGFLIGIKYNLSKVWAHGNTDY